MKKTVLHAALLALTVPMSVYGFGLGKMTIKSALDQPFLAEIELIDIPSVALSDVKVNLADLQNFQQIGFERAPALSLLSFNIAKNEQGKYVIKVQSVERMSEPYIELVIDLIWPKGQLYKAYTILLDPPGYQLVSSTIQGGPTHYKHSADYNATEPGVIHKAVLSSDPYHKASSGPKIRDKSTYGPSVADENVWQIAQRYKTSELILPQVVLAIVGANPDAFGQGNLNGLKKGRTLTIPSTQDMMQIPAQLATSEAMAHDNAWNNKVAIDHVLPPPYIGHQKEDKPDVSSASQALVAVAAPSAMAALIPNHAKALVSDLDKPVRNNFNPHIKEQMTSTQAEISIAVAALESIREANSSLVEQLHIAEKHNKGLEAQLKKTQGELHSLQAQMQLLIKQRQGFFSDGSATESGDSSSSIWPYFLILLAASASAVAYWYFRRGKTAADLAPTLVVPVSALTQDTQSSAEPTKEHKIPEVLADNESASHTQALLASSTEDMIATPHTEDAPLQSDQTHPDQDINTAHSVPDEPANNEIKTNAVVDTAVVYKSPSKAKKKIKPIEQLSDETSASDSIHQKSTQTDKSSTENEDPLSLHTDEVFKSDVEHHVDNVLQKESISVQEQCDSQAKELPLDEADSGSQNLLEFESGLHHLIPEQEPSHSIHAPLSESDTQTQVMDFSTTSTDTQPDATQEDSEGLSFDIDFFAQNDKKPDEPFAKMPIEQTIEVDDSISQFFIDNGLDEPEQSKSETNDSVSDGPVSSDIVFAVNDESLLKSKKALDTLLALAKTYLSMDDFESARHSLEEVLAHGSAAQQEEAQALLTQIKDK